MNNFIFLAFIIIIIWGIVPIFFKYIIKHKDLPSYIIIFIESIVFLTIISLYIIFFKSDVFIRDLYNHRVFIYLLIILAIFIFFSKVLYLYAHEMGVNINILTIILSLYPVITIILAYLFLKEELPLNAFIGFFFILIGIVAIFYK